MLGHGVIEHLLDLRRGAGDVFRIEEDATIRQEAPLQVSYHHVELARHDVIFAEGLPAETYLDTGNRGAFENGGGAVALHPAFSRSTWARKAFAKLVTDGETVAILRQTLRLQAGLLGHALTGDAALEMRRSGIATRLVSRSFVPAHILPGTQDHRQLGVAVTGLRLDGVAIALDDPRLVDGWYPSEDGVRWTDGDAGIAVPPGSRLEVATADMGELYWILPGTTEARRVA